jgi:hypothetical protein
MPSIVYSILTMRCPVCRKGKVFKYPVSYNIKRVGEIENACAVCGQNFRPEPGFYFGAAVVSYPLTVLFNLAVAIGYYFVTGNIFKNVFALITTMLIASLLILPLAFRYSRIIWLHIIFKYKGGFN